jgi:ribosomal protein S18 acetylase RimI-like enzyme
MSARRWWAFEPGALWAIELTGKPPGLVAPRATAAFAEVERTAADALATAMGLRGAAPVRQRFDAGRRCFAAWVDGQIAAYCWVSGANEYVSELEREFQLQDHEAYIWDCATLPAFRHQRLYSALLSRIVATLQGEGLRRIWIGASLGNRPSHRGFANAGFRPIVWVVYVRLLCLSGLWIASYPGAPGTLVAAARQVLLADHERTFGPLAVGVAARRLLM